MDDRIVEAYIGEYASGKSEVAVNRALQLKTMGRKVTIVDLDLVEPFYTLRPIKRKLLDLGIGVVAWETAETLGLGEAGSVIKPEMRWVLRRAGDIILDIGYGVEGVKVLNLIEGADSEENLKIYAVLNIGRPMTATVEDIVEYARGLGRVDGLINNSHLGDDTTVSFVAEGAKLITEAARQLKLPVVATYIDKKFEAEMSGKFDNMGNPLRFLERHMVNTFW